MPVKPKWSDQDITLAASMWEEGESMSKIGARLGISREAVSGIIHRNRDRFEERAPVRKKKGPQVPKLQKVITDPDRLLEGPGESLKSDWRVNLKVPGKAFYYYRMELTPRFTFIRRDRETFWRGHGVRALTHRQLNKWVNDNGV